MLTAIEIIILIIGFLAVCISFFVGNNSNTKTAQISHVDMPEETKEQLKKEMTDYLEGKKEQTISETEEYLNRKSNEKIMEFDEFSSQIMEKINRNHEEVVFMYQMLSDKEEQLKEHLNHASKKNSTQAAGIERKKETLQKKVPEKEKKVEKKAEVPPSQDSDLNAQMLALYKQGKSILEISKMLHVGQGEVKLIVSLYGGK